MSIEASQLVQFLLGQGILDRADVVSGDLMIGGDMSRHQAYVIMRKHGPSFFAKHVRAGQPAAAETLKHEAVCYRLIAEEPELAALRPVVPRFLAYDAGENMLVTEFVRGADNLLTFHRKQRGFSTSVASALGRTLGDLHRKTAKPKAKELQTMTPWVFSFHLSPIFQQQSAANVHLRQLISTPYFIPTLDRLRQEWQPDAFIHGDLKWENCVLEDGEENGRLLVVDWEIGNLGDPLWDVGSILNSYVGAWVSSIPVVNGEANPAGAEYPLAHIRPAMRSFWESYIESRGVESSARPGMLRRVILFMAARLLQTVYEHSAVATSLSAFSILVLQLVTNLFKEDESGYQLIYEGQ
jgi:aminoglycoside phosphotransferase (APT) family kinase protein